MFLGDEFQLGIEFGHVVLEELILKDGLARDRVDAGIGCHEIGRANHSDAFHRDTVVQFYIAAQTGLPVLREAVPPVAKRFFLVDFSGVDAGDFQAIVLTVEVDFDEAVPDVFHLFVVDGLGRQAT